jgi:parallel beta-helix repeat protein
MKNMKLRNLNLKKVVVVQFMLIGLLLGSLVYVIGSPNGTFTISPGVYPGAPSYTIWREGSTYYAKDAYGALTSGTNIATVVNSVIGNDRNIFFKKADYEFSSMLNITDKSRLAFIAEKGTYFIQKANTDIFYFGGACSEITIEGINFKSDPARSYTGYAININTEDTDEFFLLGNLKHIFITDMKNAIRIAKAWVLYIDDLTIKKSGDSATTIPALNIPKPSTGTTHAVHIRNLWIEESYYYPVFIGLDNYDILIDGFWIEYGSVAQPAYSIYVDGAPMTYIKNGVIFGGSTYAIYFASIDGELNNIKIGTGTAGGGVIIPNRAVARAGRINKVFIENVGAIGIYANIDHIEIKRCQVHQCGSHGIELNYAHYSEVSDNFVLGNTGYGIWLKDTNYTRVFANHIDDKNRDGVAQNAQTYGIIESSTSDYNIILGNVAINQLTVNIRATGSNTQVNHCWNGTTWIP